MCHNKFKSINKVKSKQTRVPNINIKNYKYLLIFLLLLLRTGIDFEFIKFPYKLLKNAKELLLYEVSK